MYSKFIRQINYSSVFHIILVSLSSLVFIVADHSKFIICINSFACPNYAKFQCNICVLNAQEKIEECTTYSHIFNMRFFFLSILISNSYSANYNTSYYRVKFTGKSYLSTLCNNIFEKQFWF